MNTVDTGIDGLIVIEPRVFDDDRGYFFESYQKEKYVQAGIEVDFIQDNESKSSYGVLRGLHYQVEPKGMSKLLRVISGKILDVVLDIRQGSKTYGSHYSIELSAENKKQLFVPKGFAHGFVVLSETTIVNYKCDEYYSKEHETGILWNDPELNIDWQINHDDAILSEKDKLQPIFANHIPYK